MKNVALLFPTGTDPRSPYLALPCLAAMLRKSGIETDLYDLDIGGLHALLEPESLHRAGLRVRANARKDSSMWRLAGLSESLPVTAPWALANLRVAERFYNPNQFHAARQTIYNALDLISAAASEPVRYGINPIRYDIEGIDTQRLRDLITATGREAANLFSEYWERDVYPELDRTRPLLAGVAINNRQQILPGLMLARNLRKRGHFVVLGGTLFTKFVNQLAKSPAFFGHFADAVVVYEGETALLELVNALETNRSLSKVPNLLYLDTNGQVRVNQTHVENVAQLPCPDFTGLPLDKYLSPEPVLPVYLGKGCYFNRCKFCDIPYINHISKKAYRLRTIEQIAADFVELNEKFGCRHFELTDEALPPRTLEHLAEALEPRQSKQFCFVGYARLETGFTPEVCRKLARMGLKKIFFGLESGAQETLDHMDKGIRISEVPGVLRNCRDAGIFVHIFSIVGFPAESERSARETYAFFERNRELLNRPGNSFDIHPFGLELRTSYFAAAESMGAFISPDALAKEFVIGVGDQWFNAWGLTHEEVRRLTAEFHAGMNGLFREYHASSEPIWPGFEEYSVLYADHYSRKEFLHRTCLPESAGLDRCSFRWNQAALIERNGNDVRVSSRAAQSEIDVETYNLMSNMESLTSKDLIQKLATHSGKDEFATRQDINAMISGGLLQLEPESEANFAMAGAR